MAKTIANVLVGASDIYVNPTAGTAVGGVGWVELGYTEEGVRFAYTVETEDIRVLAQSFPIGRIISKENLDILCQMAEASLYNMNVALAGGVLAGSTITLAEGAVKNLALKVVGPSPDPDLPTRTIYVPYCTVVGGMQQSHRRAAKTLVPVTFRAFRNATDDVFTIKDT